MTAEEFLNQKKYSSQEKLLLKNFYNNFGIAISNIINIVDPEIIVVGGGLSNHQDLYTKGVEGVILHASNCDKATTPIVKNLLGDSAGVLGAAMLPMNK